VPDTPRPDPATYGKRSFSLLLIEVCFGSDLKSKLDEKTEKDQPLIAKLQKDWGSVSLVCIPIGHAGTLLGETAHHLASALASKRPNVGVKRNMTTTDGPSTDRHALHHDTIQ
jgi:hypothetical protein